MTAVTATMTLRAVDGGCFFVLGVMDLVLETFLVIGTGTDAVIRRLHYFLFRSPSKLSEWNLAWATIGLGGICSLDRASAGGRDVFIDASRLVIGGLHTVPRVSITHPSAHEIALGIYGLILMAAGAALLWGIYCARTSPGVRRDALLFLQVIWVWSAGLIVPFHLWTVTGIFVLILALTSIALHRRALSEDRRRNERQQTDS